MKVLIIDDEPLVRRSLRRALELRGHEVEEAEDGLSGLQRWRQSPADLVFLDVLMPGLTGPAVLKEMGTEHGAKVLLMSAYSGDYDLEKVKSMGATAFIAKPFENIFAVVELAEGLRRDN